MLYVDINNNNIISRGGFRNEQFRFPRARKCFEKKKDLSKKIFFFANFSNGSKNFDEKKINIEVNIFTPE